MKKRTAFLLCFCLFLTACSASAGSSGQSAQPDASAREEPGADASVSEADAGTPGLNPLPHEDLVGAYGAAYDYYEGTVFEIQYMTETNSEEGEIAFQVTCSKGGAEQPDRTIVLERQDGVWTVISEGY